LQLEFILASTSWCWFSYPFLLGVVQLCSNFQVQCLDDDDDDASMHNASTRKGYCVVEMWFKHSLSFQTCSWSSNSVSKAMWQCIANEVLQANIYTHIHLHTVCCVSRGDHSTWYTSTAQKSSVREAREKHKAALVQRIMHFKRHDFSRLTVLLFTQPLLASTKRLHCCNVWLPLLVFREAPLAKTHLMPFTETIINKAFAQEWIDSLISREKRQINQHTHKHTLCFRALSKISKYTLLKNKHKRPPTGRMAKHSHFKKIEKKKNTWIGCY